MNKLAKSVLANRWAYVISALPLSILLRGASQGKLRSRNHVRRFRMPIRGRNQSRKKMYTARAANRDIRGFSPPQHLSFYGPHNFLLPRLEELAAHASNMAAFVTSMQLELLYNRFHDRRERRRNPHEGISKCLRDFRYLRFRMKSDEHLGHPQDSILATDCVESLVKDKPERTSDATGRFP